MSNQKCYSIDRCSIGESFDFSRAGSNDVSSNSIINSIVSCSVLSITIIISPQDQTVVAGGKIQFSAIVVNTNDNRVKWSCSAGSIDDTGLFTAPYSADTVSITAESYSYPGVTSTSTTNVVIPDIEGNIGVQARGGSWSLGGEPEFTAPAVMCWDGTTIYTAAVVASTPPRRYRLLTFSGSFIDPDPTNCYSAWVTASGGRSYDALTLAVTDTSTASGNAGGPITGLSAALMPFAYYGGALAINTGYPCYRSTENIVVSRTRREGRIGGTYNLANCEHANYGDQLVAELSIEDTPDDAIARLLATDPAWTTGQTAIRTVPTTGITGLYRRMRYGTYVAQTVDGVTTWVYTPLAGLLYTQTYHIVIFLQHRPVDSSGATTGDGSWSDSGTAYSESFQPDVNGTGGVEWQIIEPEEGYETRIASWTAELI